MPQVTINDGDSGLDVRNALNDMFGEIYAAVAADPYPQVATHGDLPAAAASAGVIGSTAVAATTTGSARVEIEAVLDVTVAGNFQFRWSQNTADAGALTCLLGSYIETMQVA